MIDGGISVSARYEHPSSPLPVRRSLWRDRRGCGWPICLRWTHGTLAVTPVSLSYIHAISNNTHR